MVIEINILKLTMEKLFYGQSNLVYILVMNKKQKRAKDE